MPYTNQPTIQKNSNASSSTILINLRDDKRKKIEEKRLRKSEGSSVVLALKKIELSDRSGSLFTSRQQAQESNTKLPKEYLEIIREYCQLNNIILFFHEANEYALESKRQGAFLKDRDTKTKSSDLPVLLGQISDNPFLGKLRHQDFKIIKEEFISNIKQLEKDKMLFESIKENIKTDNICTIDKFSEKDKIIKIRVSVTAKFEGKYTLYFIKKETHKVNNSELHEPMLFENKDPIILYKKEGKYYYEHNHELYIISNSQDLEKLEKITVAGYKFYCKKENESTYHFVDAVSIFSDLDPMTIGKKLEDKNQYNQFMNIYEDENLGFGNKLAHKTFLDLKNKLIVQHGASAFFNGELNNESILCVYPNKSGLKIADYKILRTRKLVIQQINDFEREGYSLYISPAWGLKRDHKQDLVDDYDYLKISSLKDTLKSIKDKDQKILAENIINKYIQKREILVLPRDIYMKNNRVKNQAIDIEINKLKMDYHDRYIIEDPISIVERVKVSIIKAKERVKLRNSKEVFDNIELDTSVLQAQNKDKIQYMESIITASQKSRYVGR